jgi:hypothetical protein
LPGLPQRTGDPRAGEPGRPGDAGRRPEPEQSPSHAADHDTIVSLNYVGNGFAYAGAPLPSRGPDWTSHADHLAVWR